MSDQKKQDLNYAEVGSDHPALNSEIARLGRYVKTTRILKAMDPPKNFEGYSFSIQPFFPNEGEEAGAILVINKQGSRSEADSVSILITESNRVAVRKGGEWVISEKDQHTSESADQLSKFLKKFADILERSDPENPEQIRARVAKGIKKLADF